MQKRDVGRVAGRILLVVGLTIGRRADALVKTVGAVHLVVIAAGDIQTREHDVAVCPSRVLRIRSAQRSLMFERQFVLPEAFRRGEHGRAEIVQPLQIVVAAIVLAVTIGPFVVAGHVDHRRLERVEADDRGGKHVVGAQCAPALDVSGEYRECNLRIVDLGGQRRDLRHLIRGVGGVSPKSERELRLVVAVLIGRTRVDAATGGEGDRHENPDTSGVFHKSSFICGLRESASTVM